MTGRRDDLDGPVPAGPGAVRHHPDVVLEIPGPCRWINSNQRLHFHQRAELTKHWRHAGAVFARDVAPFVGKVHILVYFHFRDRRRHDAGNWYPTAKALVDGFVDAGVLADDDDAHVDGPDMRTGCTSPRPRVTVHITEVPA